jgi:hypothetical protein
MAGFFHAQSYLLKISARITRHPKNSPAPIVIGSRIVGTIVVSRAEKSIQTKSIKTFFSVIS